MVWAFNHEGHFHTIRNSQFAIRELRMAMLCYSKSNHEAGINCYVKAAGYSDTIENIVNHDFIER